MFDPRTYRDLDYGLAADESFEPDDEGVDAFDETRPHIMTVLGPIAPEELGVCLAHERLGWATDPAGPIDAPGARASWRSVADELEAFAVSGGRAVVDGTARGERNAASLLDLVRFVPIHVIASTGWSAGSSREATTARPGPDAMIAALLGDIRDGMDGTPARAGLVAVDVRTETDAALEVGAASHRETGTPLSIRPRDWQRGEALLDRLGDLGVPAEAVIAQGLERTTPPELLRMLAERGATCSFDRISGDPATDRGDAEAIVDLVSAGFDRAPVLSMGIDWSTGSPPGRPRWPYLLEQFSVLLLELGTDAGTVRQILVDNPARALTVRFPGGTEGGSRAV